MCVRGFKYLQYFKNFQLTLDMNGPVTLILNYVHDTCLFFCTEWYECIGADPEIFERGGPEAIIYKVLERGGL